MLGMAWFVQGANTMDKRILGEGARSRGFGGLVSAAALCVLAAGCDANTPPDGQGLEQRFGAISSSRAAPLGAATLAISDDGAIAVAADPDRDAVFLVDLGSGTVRRIDTNPEDQLGQVLVAGGQAFVLARGTGEVLRIDLETATIEQRFFVALGPRGMALSDDGTLHVACASGELVSVDAQTGERTRRVLLEADLRDVVVWGAGLAVSRLRSSEVLFLDAEGALLERFNPIDSLAGAESTVAWRLRVIGSSLVLAHQFANGGVVSISEGGYESGTDFSSCGSSITTSVLSVIATDGKLPSETAVDQTGVPAEGVPPVGTAAIGTLHLGGVAGALDFAGNALDSMFVAVPGSAWATQRRQALVPAAMSASGEQEVSDGCNLETDPEAIAPVAIAMAKGTGSVVTQSREPAVLVVDQATTILLSDEARPDVGHRMFHLSTGLGIACASCHPEGRDDGHPWNFDRLGMRRSQALRGGISDLAPFHWDGSLPEFSDLMSEVFQSRMGLELDPSAEELAGMVDWLDRLPPGEPGPEVDAESAARGKALFSSEEVGCYSCHSGPRFADSVAHDVGTGGTFFTPPLNDIGSRPPYMHDSCAATLAARFGSCGGDDRHGKTSQLDKSQIDDLVAFMMTL